MKAHVTDSDFVLHVGDVLDVLREFPDASIDCCVTSPPYFGLRDYGDEAQIGLEKSPEEYVSRLVEVFREVRRVLADHGTAFLNLGDSYAADHAQKRTRVENYGLQEGIPGSRHRDFMGTPAGLKPKDLMGMPWRVAFALQAEGWWLRSEIIWAKPNPMPESCTDRPTKSHEQVFLLTKRPNYFWDQEAVREPWATTHAPGSSITETQHYGADNGGNSGLTPHLADVKARLREASRPQVETLDGSTGEAPRGPDGRRQTHVEKGEDSIQHRDGERWPNGGRNIRSVWTIATQPFAGAHFAVFPEELVRRCILAGSPESVCTACNTPVASGRQQDIAEQETVQAPLRRVRGVLRRAEREVLQPPVLAEGGWPQEAAGTSAVRAVRDDVQLTGEGALLLDEVLGDLGDEDRDQSAAAFTGLPSSKLEGREDSRRGVHQGVRQGDEALSVRAPSGDVEKTGSGIAADGVCASQERGQAGQPPGEPGTDDEKSASRDDRVSALRRELRDSLSPCCGVPVRPGVVLDPFGGSGTTALVARKHGRHSVLIELNPIYAELAAERLNQLSLFAS